MYAINGILTIFVGIFIDAIIFNIIYSSLNSGIKYLANVLIYTIGMEIKLALTTGFISLSMFLLTFGTYFIIGLVLIFILSKISEYISRFSFIILSIFIQAGIMVLSSFVINLIY